MVTFTKNCIFKLSLTVDRRLGASVVHKMRLQMYLGNLQQINAKIQI